MSNSKSEIVRHQQRIDRLCDRKKALAYEHEMQAHWAKYLCVLVSGYLEESVRLLYGSYAAKHGNDKVARFVAIRLKRFQNAKMAKILDLADSFSGEWKEELAAAAKGEIGDAVDSVVAIRHRIAHGADTGIGLVSMLNYYTSVKKLVKMIQDQCDGKRIRS